MAWSRKDARPGPALDGRLAETALMLRAREIFAQVERKRENGLFEDDGRSPAGASPSASSASAIIMSCR